MVDGEMLGYFFPTPTGSLPLPVLILPSALGDLLFVRSRLVTILPFSFATGQAAAREPGFRAYEIWM
jgi:hypothetical protein